MKIVASKRVSSPYLSLIARSLLYCIVTENCKCSFFPSSVAISHVVEVINIEVLTPATRLSFLNVHVLKNRVTANVTC